jgi:type II secretory pathway pseudopilin PulG
MVARSFSEVRRRSGFTIIEILLVLGIILLAAGVFIMNVDTAIGSIGKENPQETLQRAVAHARLTAISKKTPMTLEWDTDAAAFWVKDTHDGPVESFEIDEDLLEYVVDFRFWPIEAQPYSASGADLSAIELVAEMVDTIEFEVDGTSSFVAVECVYDSSYRDPDVWVLDPFSNGIVVTDEIR